MSVRAELEELSGSGSLVSALKQDVGDVTHPGLATDKQAEAAAEAIEEDKYVKRSAWRAAAAALIAWDLRVSRRLHTLSLGVLDYGVVLPAFLFSTYITPALQLGLVFATQPRVWATFLTAWYVHAFGVARERSCSCSLLSNRERVRNPSPAQCSLGTVLCVLVGKKQFARLRPAHDTLAAKVFNLRALEKNHAMPSGDSAQAAAFATCWWLCFQDASMFAMVPATMFGRVYFGCHWVMDTVAGVVIGTTVALCAASLVSLLFAIPLLAPFA
ncbi:phosphatase PAP2 family protein [archaeon]|nr:MAG: phosphatase PAP2 family protein [archaeon]